MTKKNLIILLFSLFIYSQQFAQVNVTLSKYVELPNKIKLEYVEQGNPAGIPVIFLHGFTDSWHSFELVFNNLGTSVHAYAITQRGHGDSDKPTNGYEISDFSNDVAAFMKKMNIGPAIIVGHSMGGIIAQRFVLDHPEMTLGLVLAGSFLRYDNKPILNDFRTVVDKLTDPVDVEFVTEFQKGTLAGPVPENFFNMSVQESMKLPAHVWQAVANGFMKADYSEELKKFSKPTLIIWGDKDVLCTSADQQLFARIIKGSDLRIYRNTGHGVHWEQPARFASDLEFFTRKNFSPDRNHVNN
jgi:pimeloyl-ACP methyl ester carboxylesterase